MEKIIIMLNSYPNYSAQNSSLSRYDVFFSHLNSNFSSMCIDPTQESLGHPKKEIEVNETFENLCQEVEYRKNSELEKRLYINSLLSQEKGSKASSSYWNFLPDFLHSMLDYFSPSHHPQSMVEVLIIRSDIDGLKRHLKQHPEIQLNQLNAEGQSPLHIACQMGLCDIVSTLVNHGANINLTNRQNKTPCAIAFAHQHFALGDSLYARGAKITSYQTTPMHECARLGYVQHIQKRVKVDGESLDIVDQQGNTPLMGAIIRLFTTELSEQESGQVYEAIRFMMQRSKVQFSKPKTSLQNSQTIDLSKILSLLSSSISSLSELQQNHILLTLEKLTHIFAHESKVLHLKDLRLLKHKKHGINDGGTFIEPNGTHYVIKEPSQYKNIVNQYLAAPLMKSQLGQNSIPTSVVVIDKFADLLNGSVLLKRFKPFSQLPRNFTPQKPVKGLFKVLLTSYALDHFDLNLGNLGLIETKHYFKVTTLDFDYTFNSDSLGTNFFMKSLTNLDMDPESFHFEMILHAHMLKSSFPNIFKDINFEQDFKAALTEVSQISIQSVMQSLTTNSQNLSPVFKQLGIEFDFEEKIKEIQSKISTRLKMLKRINDYLSFQIPQKRVPTFTTFFNHTQLPTLTTQSTEDIPFLWLDIHKGKSYMNELKRNINLKKEERLNNQNKKFNI